MSSTIDAEVIERYAGEAAFLWSLRHGAVSDPLHDLESLCALDERIEAHLSGLLLAGDEGWEVCEAALEEADPGNVFVAMVMAAGQPSLVRIARVLDAWGGDPKLARGIVSALGWVPLENVQAILPGLLFQRCSPALHYAGIAGAALHRQDVGPALGYALLSSEQRLRSRALRAAGELGRKDLLPEIGDDVASSDEACQIAAAWSAALLGDPKAPPALRGIAEKGGDRAPWAASMAVRRLPPDQARGWLADLARSPEHVRSALQGAASLGDPGMVPWLLELLETPELARPAGAALTMITGLDLAAEKLKTRPPEGFHAGPTDDPDDDDVAMDPDASLPWPDVEGVRAWWKRSGPSYRSGIRHLVGNPMSPEWIVHVLRDGSQPARASAAVELCMHHGGKGLFEVRAPGERQKKALG